MKRLSQQLLSGPRLKGRLKLGAIWQIAVAASFIFVVYLGSAYLLAAEQRDEALGADAGLYRMLAYPTFAEDRVTAFHVVTVLLARAWIGIIAPLVGRIAPDLWPPHMLHPLLAAVGAAGVIAAIYVASKFLARRDAILFGVIYGLSLGVWYFSCVPESKGLTAALIAVYLAVYLRFRDDRSMVSGLMLSGIMFAACMNDLTSAALLVIPLFDSVMRGRFDKSACARIGMQLTIGVVGAVVIQQLMVPLLPGNGSESAKDWPVESGAVALFLKYFQISDHSPSAFWSFLLNWLFFNIAAPQEHATHALALWPDYKGFFEPSLFGYLTSVTTLGLAGCVASIIYFAAAPTSRGRITSDAAGLMMGLLAFSVVRGVFFFLFNPGEAILFSSSVVLPHLLLFSIPFGTAKISDQLRTLLLSGFAVLLFLANGRFIFALSWL